MHSEEILNKRLSTTLERYGSLNSFTHTKEAKDRRDSNRKSKLRIKFPELDKICILKLGEDVILESNMLDMLIYLFGSENGISYKYRLLDKLSKGTTWNSNSKWYNHKIIYK